MIAQSEEWFAQHIGKNIHSLLDICGASMSIIYFTNDKAIGTVQIPIADTNIWSRKR